MLANTLLSLRMGTPSAMARTMGLRSLDRADDLENIILKIYFNR